MGESAVLLRSFSHPSDASREVREGDPIRALTESISFGRFMSESLAWEKWSTFSHNRYLEEVEKFSRPGTVAEKKAYFEAHYKKKAAMKAAAAVEEAIAAVNEIPGLKTTSEILDNSPTDTDSAKENSHTPVKEQKEQQLSHACADSHIDTGTADKISHVDVVADDPLKSDSPNAEVAPTEANICYSINTEYDLGDADMERGEAVIEYAANVEKQTQDDNLKQLWNPDFQNKIEASSPERMPNKEVVDEENSGSSSKKKLASCSSKLSSEGGLSRFASYKIKQASSLPAARNINNITANNEETVGDSNGKKIVPRFLQKSINFSPHVTETNKASLKKPKDSSTPIRTSTRASVNGISKHLSKIFQSEDKRSKTVVSMSVSGGITEAGRLQSPSSDSLKSSTSNGIKRRPPCISSPFSFRSEERVAKRKEFFQKLEEKTKAKEAERGQLETRSKDKAQCDIKKVRQSTSFEAKQNKDLHCGSHLPNAQMKKEKAEHDIKKLRLSTSFKAIPSANCAPSTTKQIKKMPLYQPCSPKLEGKPRPAPTVVLDSRSRPPRKPSVSTDSSKTCSVTFLPKLGRRPTSSTIQDAHTRPLWRSSMNSASFKRSVDKNNGSTNRSITSLPKKNARENASPNILV